MHPRCHPRDFFSLKPRDKFWNPSHFGDAMSGKRFERINEYLKLDDEEEAPECRDRLVWIRNMKKGFNENIDTEFNSSWLSCIDENMVALCNTHAPGWMCLDRNPHPLGNEHYTIT